MLGEFTLIQNRLARVFSALVFGALLVSAQAAWAIPPFWAQFEAKYVKADSADEKQKAFSAIAASAETGKCNVCHVKGQEKKVRNRYGVELSKLLMKKDFSSERLQAEPDKAKQEIVAALDKVAAVKSDPADEKSPTFGELIAQGKLPGGDAPAPAEPAKPDAPKPDAPKPAEPAKPETPAPAPPPVPKHVETPAEKEAIAKVIAVGGSVRDIAMNDDSKDVDFHLGGTALTDEGLAQLKAIPNIVALSLKDTQITDAGLANIAGITTLNRLHLEKTKVTDAGLVHLKGLANLEYLNLYGTEVTDAGLEHLKALTKLKKLYLWQSKVTDQGVTQFKTALPAVEVVK